MFSPSFEGLLNIVIVRNCVIVKLTFLLCLFNSFVTPYPPNTYRDLDICNHWNGRRHFLELGERGDLHARNVTTSAFRVRNVKLYFSRDNLIKQNLTNKLLIDFIDYTFCTVLCKWKFVEKSFGSGLLVPV